MPNIALVIALLAALACWGDARAAACKDQKPTTWDIEVGPASEPGERLEVTGRVISSADRKPLAGVTVYVYHADEKGHYNLAGHENEAPRLCGILRTNAQGQYRIRTSMPGGYGGFAAHIHYEVWGPRVARQYLFVNLVGAAATMDTSRALHRPSQRPARGDATASERPVYRGADGVHRMVKDLAVGAR